MTNNYTSISLSKKLAEGGCKIKSNHCWAQPRPIGNEWCGGGDEYRLIECNYGKPINDGAIPAYDLLWDICIKHAKEFFGEEFIEADVYSCDAWVYYPGEILNLLQQNKKQKAEDYIWEHCRFNKKNQ